MDNLKLAGKIGKPHGIRGFLSIHPFYDIDWDKLNTLFIEINTDHPPIPYLIDRIEFLTKKTIIKLKNLDSINEIKKFTNKNFFVNRNVIIENPAENFINYTVVDINHKNTVIGKVTDYIQQGDIQFYVVSNEQQKEILLPINDVFIHDIDINNEVIYYKSIEGMY